MRAESETEICLCVHFVGQQEASRYNKYQYTNKSYAYQYKSFRIFIKWNPVLAVLMICDLTLQKVLCYKTSLLLLSFCGQNAWNFMKTSQAVILEIISIVFTLQYSGHYYKTKQNCVVMQSPQEAVTDLCLWRVLIWNKT